MAYIGKQPVVGNFQVCDAISVVNGQAAYTMQVTSANVEPENANHMLVSLNGVLQKPGSSFTISGATITFASNLVTNDVIDFIILLGDTLNVGTPSDDSVGAAQIKADLISGTTALAAEPADTDEFLVSDAGVLKRIDYSLIKGGGITEADQFRLTANQSAGTNAVVTSNLERVDTDGFLKLGTGLTNSSGVFSFPSTGYYLIMVTAKITAGSSHNDAQLIVETTTDNSTFEDAVQVSAADGSGGSTNYSVHGQFLFDVTNISTHKFRLITASMSSSFLNGDTAKNETHFTTLRLADT